MNVSVRVLFSYVFFSMPSKDEGMFFFLKYLGVNHILLLAFMYIFSATHFYLDV
jgi:hypothetical protein